MNWKALLCFLQRTFFIDFTVGVCEIKVVFFALHNVFILSNLFSKWLFVWAKRSTKVMLDSLKTKLDLIHSSLRWENLRECCCKKASKIASPFAQIIKQKMLQIYIWISETISAFKCQNLYDLCFIVSVDKIYRSRFTKQRFLYLKRGIMEMISPFANSPKSSLQEGKINSTVNFLIHQN